MHPAAQNRSFDAGKKIVGRKRHIAVDTDGRLLKVNLTTANSSDSASAQKIVVAMRKCWPWLKHLFADRAYARTRIMDAATYQHFVLEIIGHSDKEAEFKLLPRRWVVERTVGWMTRCKRLECDYEQRIDFYEVMIHIALRKPHAPQNSSPMIILKRTLTCSSLEPLSCHAFAADGNMQF